MNLVVCAPLLLWAPLLLKAEPASPLRLRFVPGSELVYLVVSEKSVATTDDPRNPFRSTAGYTLAFRTSSVAADGEAVLQVTLNRLQWTVTGGANAGVFDSQAPAPVPERPDHAALRHLAGKSFAVTLSPHGVVRAIRGAEALSPAAPGLTEVMGETQLAALLRTLFSWLPPEPTQGQWTRQETLPLGFIDLVRTNHSRVTGATGDRVNIATTIALTSADPAATPALTVTGKLLPNAGGAAALVFNARSGVLEVLESQVAFTLETQSAPAGKRKGSVKTTHVLSARTSATLVAPASPSAN